MKVCKVCGEEINTRDGENECTKCNEVLMMGSFVSDPYKRRKASSRKARENVMRDLGLTKVRGAMGGVYWE